MEILNGKITETRLGEEHGCLSAYITIEGDGWGCSSGGYVLDHWCNEPGHYYSSDGYGAIIELMKTFEVESWEELVGQYCRVESDGWGGKLIRIGHLMKDKWFSWKDYFEEVKRVNEVSSDEN